MDNLPTNRREIPLSPGIKTLYVVLGMFFAVLSIAGAWLPLSSHQPSLASLAFLAFLPVGIYLLALAFRSRVTLEGPSITVRGAFQQRTASLHEIAGFRTISSRNGSYWILQLRDSNSSITVQKSFDCDDLREWLARLPDLDERDRQQVLDDISSDQALGATPEQRLAALRRARAVGIGLTALVILSAFVFALAPEPYRSLGAYFIAIGPLAIIYLVRTQPLLYAVFRQRRDPRSELSIAFLACAFAMVFGTHDTYAFNLTPLAPWIVGIALACCVGLLPALKNRPQMFGIAIALIFFSGIYGYGLAFAANSMLDRSELARYQTTVTSMHVSQGKSTSYHLKLAPWGPADSPYSDRSLSISVPLRKYQATHVGGTVCLDYHPGALNAPWYKLVNCSPAVE
jgi:hypothetical protein